MHYGSELVYTARKKKNPLQTHIQHLVFCYLAVLSLICTTAMLGLAENGSRAWERFQLVCHIQAGFLDRNFSKFLGLTVLLICIGNSSQVSTSPMQIQGTENLPLLVVCWNCISASYVFTVKNNLLPTEFLYSEKILAYKHESGRREYLNHPLGISIVDSFLGDMLGSGNQTWF